MTATTTPAVAQQTPATRLAEQARAQIDGLNVDSAFTLLAASLRQSTTDRERLRGFTLLAFVELIRGNQLQARQAFERAIRLDPAMKIDSLADLSTESRIVFSQAQSAVGSVSQQATSPAVRAPLALAIDVAADTTLAVANPRLVIAVQPNARARLVSSIVTADASNRVVFQDTRSANVRQWLEWSLRGADGALIPPGRYVLRVQATDSATGETPPVLERFLRVTRVAADTQPLPPPLAASAFAPERGARGQSKRSTLVWGGSIAGMIVLTPMLMGNSVLNDGLSSDPTSYAVAGGVAVASVVGFLKGKRPVVLAENVSKNQQLRDDDRRKREAIVAANAAARAQAPVRVTVERAP